MTEQTDRERREALRAHYADEEAENAAAEAAEAAAEDQAVLSVRVPTSLAEALKSRAAAEHTSQSALVRRLLTQTVRRSDEPVLTVGQVEEIARRIVEEYGRAS